MLARGFWGILFGPLGEKEEKKGRMGKRKKKGTETRTVG